MKNKGFSLVELIVVIAIMAVLMAVLAPTLLRYVEKTRQQRDDSAVAEVRNALELALSDDAIFTDLAGRQVTVQVNGSTGAITVTEPATAPHDAILSELHATAGDRITIDSKDRSGKIYAVRARWASDRITYQITDGAWSADGTAVE
jgi:prepilin-type N-terminal cleavage/methylation domain-containing protein